MIEIESSVSKEDNEEYSLKAEEMEKCLKQSPGIDVSKLNLSLSLSSQNESLVKQFKFHPDVSNDVMCYKMLLKCLHVSVNSDVELSVVM